jgi:phosphoadenosine phosphosulfate reductase
MRAAQSVTRKDLAVLEWDEENQLMKLNPLAAWTDEDLAEYVKKHNLPLHPLYGEGFKSIGCSPCTRAVLPDEDIRAGRWWWEDPAHKECGIHRRPRPGAAQGAHL